MWGWSRLGMSCSILPHLWDRSGVARQEASTSTEGTQPEKLPSDSLTFSRFSPAWLQSGQDWVSYPGVLLRKPCRILFYCY